MDLQKEIAIMTDKKNASIAWFNATNNATALLDVLIKNGLCKTENMESVLSQHANLRNTILMEHNTFTRDVLSKIGTGPSQAEIDELLQKIRDCKDGASLRTLYLTTREELRGVVLDAVNTKKAELTK